MIFERRKAAPPSQPTKFKLGDDVSVRLQRRPEWWAHARITAILTDESPEQTYLVLINGRTFRLPESMIEPAIITELAQAAANMAAVDRVAVASGLEVIS